MARKRKANDMDSTSEITSLDVGVAQNSPDVDIHGRSMVEINDLDYVTVHNLLYFQYTGRVHHHDRDTAMPLTHELPKGYPAEADAFTLYRAANMYLLDGLQKRCRKCLVETCTPENISDRLFDTDVKYHEPLARADMTFLLKNYEEVKELPAWDALFFDRDGSVADYQYRLLLLHLSPNWRRKRRMVTCLSEQADFKVRRRRAFLEIL